MTTKSLYRFRYVATDPTKAEQAADKAKDIAIYRYASSDKQAIIIAKKHIPTGYTLFSIQPAPNLPTIDNN